jgi:hypothetical protein
VAAGLPRASAVLILNDPDTGYPFACLESSIISATRTAALAASAADWLIRGRGRPARAGFFGAGLIARYIHTFLAGTGWSFDEIGVHDVSADHADGFRGYLEQGGAARRITVHERAEQLIRSSDLVIFATVAGQPHVTDPAWFDYALSVLRDLAPQILLASTNIVDDVDHCLRAGTSPHLAEQLTGGRGFLHGTLDDVMAGGGDTRGPACRVLAVRPRGARSSGRQVRLRRGRPSRRIERHRRLLPRVAPVRITRAAPTRVSGREPLDGLLLARECTGVWHAGHRNVRRSFGLMAAGRAWPVGQGAQVSADRSDAVAVA